MSSKWNTGKATKATGGELSELVKQGGTIVAVLVEETGGTRAVCAWNAEYIAHAKTCKSCREDARQYVKSLGEMLEKALSGAGELVEGAASAEGRLN